MQWSDVGLLLTQVKTNVQDALVKVTNQVNSSGISTETGLRGLNLDGELFSRATEGAENKMQQELDQAYKLQALSYLWKLQVSQVCSKHHISLVARFLCQPFSLECFHCARKCEQPKTFQHVFPIDYRL